MTELQRILRKLVSEHGYENVLFAMREDCIEAKKLLPRASEALDQMADHFDQLIELAPQVKA